ncbi:MAG: hypothetical protein ACK4KT_04170 [Thermaurantimonas sp.]
MKWILWFLLLGFLIFSEYQLRTAGEKYLKPAFDGMNLPDLSIGISKEDLLNFFETGGRDGIEIYAKVIMRYDFLYPLSYGLFFAYTIFLLTRRFKTRWISTLPLLPILSMLADLVENSSFVLLAYEYPSFNDTLFSLGRTAQLIKWYVAFTSVAVILSLLITHAILLIKGSKVR